MNLEELYKLFRSSAGISIDSRTVKAEQLFFAIKGDRFDGNRYARQAIEAGADFAIVDDPDLRHAPNMILVENALASLQQLANYHRRFFKGRVIAITGSNGKTTSKELTHAILSTQYYTFATKGNLNNHIGTPLTLLSMPADLDFAVVEFGDNHPGEIAMLSDIAQPDFGVVTNVGKDHLEGFGGWKGVYRARKELVDHLAKYDKPAFVNTDLDYLVEMAKGLSSIITYGTSADVQFRYEMKESNPYVRMKMFQEGQPVVIQSHLFGRYNFQNMMLAATIGQYFKVSMENIGSAIEGYLPKNNRSQIIEWRGNHVLMDAYNANPSNVEAALESFANLKNSRKMVILGDMLELGKHAGEEHVHIAELATTMGFDKIVLVGSSFRPMAQRKGLLHFDNVELLKKWFYKNPPKGYWILVKGSRKISLEKLVD